MCTYDNMLLRQFHLLTGWHHVLVSDKVSNITSLSYISHSRVKESRRGVPSIILSWLDSGVSRDVMLVSSILGVARRSPGSDVFSILISAGVFKLPRTLLLMSVPERKQMTHFFLNFFFFIFIGVNIWILDTKGTFWLTQVSQNLVVCGPTDSLGLRHWPLGFLLPFQYFCGSNLYDESMPKDLFTLGKASNTHYHCHRDLLFRMN